MPELIVEPAPVITATNRERVVTPAIEVRGVTKRFRRLEVLKGTDLSIVPGRVTGLVGPNASGKTTLMKAVLGLVRPDRGTILVNGQPAGPGFAYRTAIGYMPQAAHFPENLTGLEVLRLLKDLRGRPEETDQSLLEGFDFDGELKKPVRTLSGGTRQKLNAAIAFLFGPSLLILDEPTAGLDPIAAGLLKEKVRSVRETGATVLLASHTLSELEELADDIVFLLDGRVRFQGPVARLAELTGSQHLERAIASLMQRGVA
jgi:Cu-processing system ATP-binding protein